LILITGASGSVGGAVLQAIRQSGRPFRAMYRSAEDAGKAPAGVATAVADFASKDSLKSALAGGGIEQVFLVCSPIPQLVDYESNVIDVSRESGVKHIVLSSALGAGDYQKSFPSWHHKVEVKLQASGIGYTILRPNGFLQNLLTYNAPGIRAQSAFYAGQGDSRVSLLDVRDVAAVAAKALLSPAEHAGKTYELHGPEALTNAEIAARISAVVGRTVTYINIPEEAQRASMLGMGMPEWQVTAILELQQYYVQGGGSKVTPLLEQLLGRSPIGLDAFLAEFKEQFSA
jgi:uncharacterized protein YbjT (DUF2867 family)